LAEGTRVVETLTPKNLYAKLGLDSEEHQNWTLVDYVNSAARATTGH